MPEQNIWESLDLSEDNVKNSYDYLVSQIDNFKNATRGELQLDIEVTQTTSSDSAKRQMTIYTLSVVAPNLGSFRKKLLDLIEFDDQGRFPVNLWNYLEEKMVKDIPEAELLNVLKNVLSTPRIKGVIENLFRQSLEAKRKIQ